MTRMILAAAAATLSIAAPASAATFVFNFNTVAPTSTTSASGSSVPVANRVGDSMTWTQTVAGETLSVRVSAFTLNTNGTITLADLGRWTGTDGGLGAIASNENGNNNTHTVDGYNGNDFLVFQFSKSVEATTASANAFPLFSGQAADNDMIIRVGSTMTGASTGFTAGQMQASSGMTFVGTDFYAAGTGSNALRDINPADKRGNLLFIAAGGTDSLYDAFKLRQLTVVTQAAPVPEPTTWAMMIAGFGMVGMGLRRRSQNAPHVLA